MSTIHPPSVDARQSESVATVTPEPDTSSASQMAHDLRNFLSCIRMLSEDLQGRLFEEDFELKPKFAAIDESARRAGEICEHLQLTLRGEEVDQISHQQIQEINVSTLINNMKELLEVMAGSETALVVDAASNLPRISANTTQLQRVVLDLISNAFQALGPLGGSIFVRTGRCKWPNAEASSGWRTGNSKSDAESMAARKNYVYLEVADSGCGMDEKTVSQLFRSSFTTKPDGHGLGINSVLQIVKGFGGTVAVASQLGEGTTVRCLFPYETLSAECGASSHPSHTEVSNSRPQPEDRKDQATVLLIEDNESARFASTQLLNTIDHGKFTVIPCANGRDALGWLEEDTERFSVIVMDLQLPDCQGSKLFYKMREMAPGTPIVVVSGIPASQLKHQFGNLRPEAFLTKPVDPEQLVAMVLSLTATTSHREPPLARFMRSRQFA